MADYSKTIIYSIKCNTNDSLIYVGHTTEYTKRKCWHKCQSFVNDKPLYKMIRENGNWDNFTMTPIMEFPCENKNQACIQEEKCRLELKATLNTYRCIKNEEAIKEKRKEYREENKEHIKEDAKRYYQEHIEERKAYRETIKEDQKVYKREWYAERKEEINKKRSLPWTCECGHICSYSNKARHLKTHNN
jgi:hypothetical protein